MLRTFPSVVSEMVLCWVGSVPPVSLWSPEVTDRSEPNCIGALLPNNNTGEVSAFYHALKWIRVSDGISSKPVRRRLNLITDSEYCVRPFMDNSPSRRAAIRFSFSTSVVVFKRSVPIMTLPFPGSRRTRAAPLPKHWVMRRRNNWRPRAAPPLVPRATGPSSGPPSTDGDTLPLAPSPSCSFAPTYYLS